MTNYNYFSDDVAVVGMGCVLPDANNPKQFWQNLQEGKCSINTLPDKRWKSELYYRSNKRKKDKIYSNLAAAIKEDDLREICRSQKIDFNITDKLHFETLEALRQAIDCIDEKSLNCSKNKCSIILGSMNQSEKNSECTLWFKIKDKFENYLRHLKFESNFVRKTIDGATGHLFSEDSTTKEKLSLLLINSLINKIKEKYAFQGQGFLVDAACASSLAAIDISCILLKNYQSDLVITGGIDDYLSPDVFAEFCVIGAMSDKGCYPFDSKANGLILGEGSVIFALQRLEDAVKNNNKIYAIIKSCEGSSDGRSSSIFSPIVSGQLLVYQKAYKNIDNKNVDYIECHGTGTLVGDSTEIESLSSFFAEKKEKIPIGSVKSLVGHTKGAAGAVGVLKSILCIQNRKVTASKYLENSIIDRQSPIYINKDEINFEDRETPLRFGVSSFGFGNINYHLVLEEYKRGKYSLHKRIQNKENDSIVVLASHQVHESQLSYDYIQKNFSLPPQSLPHMASLQLLALTVVREALNKFNININLMNKERISVMAASCCLGSNHIYNFNPKATHLEFLDLLPDINSSVLRDFFSNEEQYTEITEDTPAGSLNNVIAGRISNIYDLKGTNYNIDAEFNSRFACMNMAVQKLQQEKGMVILLLSDEGPDEEKLLINRKGISAMIFANSSVALEHEYPIQYEIKNINYQETFK